MEGRKMYIDRRSFLKCMGVIAVGTALNGFIIDFVNAQFVGEPLEKQYIRMRQGGLYDEDEMLQAKGLGASHENPTIKMFYEKFAGHPLSEVSKKLLHTTYFARPLKH